jgi:hypothetical protein
MVRLLFVLLLLPASLAECGSQERDLDCLQDCDLCSASSGCPADRCGLLVGLSADCTGLADPVEVAVDQCVEEEDLHPGETNLSCATILKGRSATVTGRADDWVWQRQVTCTADKAGHLVYLMLQCGEQ